MDAEASSTSDKQGQDGKDLRASGQDESKIKIDEASSEKGSLESGRIALKPETPQEAEGRKSNLEIRDESRPVSSVSVGPPKSAGVAEVVFETRRKKRKTPPALVGHEVTFTVTIAMAIPTEIESPKSAGLKRKPSDDEEDQPNLKDMLKKKKRTFEAPKAQNYFHLEYRLVPDNQDIMKTDVVTYGLAAKIYTDCHDPRVIKTWQDGDITWLAWSHSHTVTITEDLLLKFFDHHVELQIWDSKEKTSTRARFDRPKAFRLPQAKPGEDIDDIGGVKSQVLRQLNSFTKLQPRKGGKVRELPKTTTFTKQMLRKKMTGGADGLERDDGKQGEDGDKPYTPSSQMSGHKTSSTGHTLVAVHNSQTSSGHEGRTFSRLGKLAGAERPTMTPVNPKMSKGSAFGGRSNVDVLSSRSRRMANVQVTPSASTIRDRTSAKSRDSEGKSPAGDRNARRKRKEGTGAACSVSLRIALLFSGMKSVTGRLDKPVPGIEDTFVTISLNRPLMSEEQQKSLNPMIMKIQSANNLPDTPMSSKELNSKCLPVYCKYSFFNNSPHVSASKEHAENIYWDDINVVLLGTLEQSALREYLNGPPLEIEVHDRDRKHEEVKIKPTLFGDDLEDEKISNVGTVTSKRTLHNAFKGRDKPWDPYGVAKFDLSELLQGHRYLYLTAPIHNAPIPDVLGSESRPDGKLMGVAGAVDGPVDRPLTPGHYMRANSLLKIKIQLSVPLSTPEKLAAKPPVLSTKECPFNRIVFMFEYSNLDMLYKLQRQVAMINAHALELDDMPQHVIDAALSTYKLSLEQQQSRTLDIVTGFHVLDRKWHIFLLEGLHDRGIQEVWNNLQPAETSNVKVLYNSDLTFSERLYAPLDVDLCRIKLHEPLSLIVQQSLLYIRDMVPKPCFQALVKLDQLLMMQKMKDVVRNDLFPTADMVVSMSKEFGVPFTAEDIEDLRPESDKEASAQKETEVVETQVPLSPLRPRTTRTWTPIDHFNPTYMDRLSKLEKFRNDHDFLKENIDAVKQRSDISKVEQARTKPQYLSADVDIAHNASTHTLNATELAKEKLRQVLSQHSDTLFTYNPEFHHSMTMIPVNEKALKQRQQVESVARWKSPGGWVYPGKKTMQESNVHPKQIDLARAEELREKWHENFFHVNILQPPLERDRYPWSERYRDLNLYGPPPEDFGAPAVLSIQKTGVKLQQEKLDAKLKDMEIWQSKIVVDDTSHHLHRLLPETEMTDQGFYSSNQIDRLRGLLKSVPQKYSLKQPGMALEDIPALNVVLNPSIDTAMRSAGVSLPPAFDPKSERNKGFQPGPYQSRSWNMESNKIPVYDYRHQMHKENKGSDFNLYVSDRSRLWKKPIKELMEEEMKTHLFRIPEERTFFQKVQEHGQTGFLSPHTLWPQKGMEATIPVPQEAVNRPVTLSPVTQKDSHQHKKVPTAAVS